MGTKDAVLEMFLRMPDDVTLADIMAALHFRKKADRGLREIEDGKGIPHDQAPARLQKWLT